MTPGDVLAVRGSQQLVYDGVGDDGWSLAHIREGDQDFPAKRFVSLYALGGWRDPSPVTAGGDSWRWQLRDRNGKWIEMGAEVKWLAAGLYKNGIVIGSPKPGMATVREILTHLVQNIPSSRLEVVRSAAEVLETTVQRRQGGARWQDLDLSQNPALVQFVQRAKEGKAALTDWSTSGDPVERFFPDEVRDIVREAFAPTGEGITEDMYLKYFKPLGLTHEDIDNMHFAVIASRDYSEERDEYWTEHKDEIQYDRIEEIRGGQVAIRMTRRALSNLLADGRYKSQFETNTSMGTFAPSIRAQMELAMMGVHPDLDPTQRPVYGYVYREGNPWDTDSVLSSYGEVILLLRPEVRERTTMTLGDSLGGDAVPLPLTGEVTKRQMTDALTYCTKGAFRRGGEVDIYTEAQIHGGVTLEDIEGIIGTDWVLEEAETQPNGTRSLGGIPVLSMSEYLAAHPVTIDHRGWTLRYKQMAWSATKDRVRVEAVPPEGSEVLQRLLDHDRPPTFASVDEARNGIDRMLQRYEELTAVGAEEAVLEEDTGDAVLTYKGWEVRISEDGVEARHPDVSDTLYFPSTEIARTVLDRFDLMGAGL